MGRLTPRLRHTEHSPSGSDPAAASPRRRRPQPALPSSCVLPCSPQEKTKVKALSDELENPMNVHRWRKLEGSDPTTFEMIQKIHTLQKRLISKTEEASSRAHQPAPDSVPASSLEKTLS